MEDEKGRRAMYMTVRQASGQWRIPDKRENTSLSLFEMIDQKKIELDSFAPLTEAEREQLIGEFAAEYIYNSNAIGGNTLTLYETNMVLCGRMIGQKPLKDHIAAVGHKAAFDYVQELVREQTPLSEGIIKQIHSLVLADRKEECGVYRKKFAWSTGAREEPALPYRIASEMEKLLDVYQSSTGHILSRLARFHIEFDKIRPFAGGNGRTGRLLVNLELMKAGYPPIDIRYEDRTAYYDAFDAYYEEYNPGAMEQLFAGYANERLDSCLAMLGERR